ncbi:MAG: type II toxin-antitoxin system RelE/ParE family toxin [Chthoniobacter sp.]
MIVRPLAMEDIAGAAAWYEEQSPGLGEELTDEIIKAIGHAQNDPALFRIVRSRDEMRRVMTKRFPYRVYFSTVQDTLYVHAVLHGAQHDKHWRERW